MIHVARRTAALAGALVLAGAVLATAEDLTITSKSSSGNAAPTTSTQYFSAGRFRTSDGLTDTIVDLGTGAITFVDHKGKSYWVTNQAEMEAAFKQLDEQMKAMGGMGGLMEKMMGGPIPPVQVAKGTQPKTVAGYATDHWIVTMGDWKYELWAAKDLQLPGNYWDAMKAPYAAMGPMARRFGSLFEGMKQVKGFPLASSTTIKLMGKTQATTQEATEVKKGTIPASAFDVPAGYKKKDSPLKDMAKH